MRPVLLIAALMLLVGCGQPQSNALSEGRASPSPAATPTPDVALRLMDRVRNMTGFVRRVDRIGAAQEKWGDILKRSGSKIPGASTGEDVWGGADVGAVAQGVRRGGT